MAGEPLIDGFGRVHDSLRVGVTDRCNLRCAFCMPARGIARVPRGEILSFEEIVRFARVAASLGIAKLRLTGGEPLIRKDLPGLVAALAGVPGLNDLALTTNAVLLEDLAAPLRSAGLHRVNIHLDTLDPRRFAEICRRGELGAVLRGVAAAKRAGFPGIKINAVAVKGFSEPDIVPLARFGREHGIEIRYIEFMPLDAERRWDRSKVLPAGEIVEMLSREIAPLEEIADRDGRAPATAFRFADGVGRIGIVAAVSRPFCARCNRLRLTAEGKLRSCLFAVEEIDVKPHLRGDGSEEGVAAAIRAAVAGKREGHEINRAGRPGPSRPMYTIGG